jgi:putative flippase GtrA
MTFLFRQFSSFVVVGVIATGVHYALLIGLVEIAGIPAVAAALVGYGASGTVSYGLNRRLTFRTKLPHEAAVSRFTVVAAVGFGLTYIFMSLFVHAAGIPYLPAQVATTGIVLLWNFAAHRMWTFPADRDANWRPPPKDTQGHRARGGSDDKIASTLPPVFKPKMVPRSYIRLNSA